MATLGLNDDVPYLTTAKSNSIMILHTLTDIGTASL